MELQCKPDLDLALKRVEAWFEHEIIDRAPIRFSQHNADYSKSRTLEGREWPDLKARWFDAEFQVDAFAASIEGRLFHAETFPVFWPNLGPNVFAAFHGAELEYGEVTSWIRHCVHDWSDMERLRFSRENLYFKKIEELTRVALEKCSGKFMVGYTDFHPGVDCAADWRDSQELCIDLIESPEEAHRLIALATENFQAIYDQFDAVLKSHGQLSVTWMGIPSRGKMHIPSCDFSTLISGDLFDQFCLPVLQQEVKPMTDNIFHLDGKGVARHLDRILEVPEIKAIQWVQGVADDQPIMQWVPLIQKIQAAGKSVVVDLQPAELEDFMSCVDPRGIYLCMAAPEEAQPAIIRRVLQWEKP